MLENHASKIDRWQVYTVIGCFATKRFASKVTVAAIAPVIVVLCWYLILGPFQAKVLSICITFLCILVLTAINAFMRILPSEGREYLDMIENVFGPQTRAEVWKWWWDIQSRQDGGKGRMLDVEAIARQVGEYHPDPNPGAQSGD